MSKKVLFFMSAVLALIFMFIGVTSAEATQSSWDWSRRQAAAQVAIPQAVQSTPGVPLITCDYPTSCVLAYFGNGAQQGYWAARHFNGTQYVRLTLVAGWDNTYVAPITCAYEDSCVQDFYYDHWRDFGYLIARQKNGTIWVRESMVDGN
jgi:hypothetical protein